MTRLFFLIPLALLFQIALAQQDAQFSQYMFNNMSINPGYAGSKNAICLTGYGRNQWVGFKGAPTTALFTVSAPVKLFKISSGLGLSAINDNVGFQNSPGLDISYAYVMNLKNGDAKLGIGLSVGFLSSTFDASSQGGYVFPDNLETTVPGSSKETGSTYDLGFGIYYHTDNLYFGLSSTHLTESSYKFKQSNTTFALKRHYYVTSGMNLATANPSIVVQPSFMVRYDGASTSIDLNSLVFFNKRIWGGLSYRVNAAIVGLAGIQLANGIRVGYSYDFSLNGLNASTHEIMVSYSFSIVKEKIPHKYRSVRFL